MYILGYNWFQLVREYYNTSDLWKRQNWTGAQQTAYDLGIFVWVLIGILVLIIMFVLLFFLFIYFDDVKYFFVDIKDKIKEKFKRGNNV